MNRLVLILLISAVFVGFVQPVLGIATQTATPSGQPCKEPTIRTEKEIFEECAAWGHTRCGCMGSKAYNEKYGKKG